MANNESSQGVSTCYVFKSRLQEYAQKVGFPTPVYETIKEGPSHEPSFMSTVIVNDVRYDSLPGFFNRKAAEQSAAEVALVELSNNGQKKWCISQPVHQTGLCKNLLQEYAQKMNFAIPLYECKKYEKRWRVPTFTCTVDIGGIKYIGGAATTKKEAEIKAARTALLAIQSSGLGSNPITTDYSAYTVRPSKKRVTDLGISNQETAAALKPKKDRFKKKSRKKRNASDSNCLGKGNNAGRLEVKMESISKQEPCENTASSAQGSELGHTPIATSAGDLVPINVGTTNLGINSYAGGNLTEVNVNTGVKQVTSTQCISTM